MDITRAIFETDCKGVIDRIGHVQHDITELDTFVLSIQRLLLCNSHFSVSFARREANYVSHILAKKCLLLDDCMDLYHVPPCVGEVLFNEMA